MKWYRLAAAQGYATAQANLGSMYAKGQGVPQDFETAHMWLTLAAARLGTDATAVRDEIDKKLNPADLVEAERRAEVCLASKYQDCD